MSLATLSSLSPAKKKATPKGRATLGASEEGKGCQAISGEDAWQPMENKNLGPTQRVGPHIIKAPKSPGETAALPGQQFFDLLSQGRDRLLPITHYTKLGLPENIGLRVLIYGHDSLRAGATCHVLA